MLTLDPLGGRAGACGGSNGGNGQAPSQRRTPLSVEQCLAAMEECDVPVVAICGGEPLEYEGIAELTRAIPGPRQASFPMYEWHADSAVFAHDPAGDQFVLEREA